MKLKHSIALVSAAICLATAGSAMAQSKTPTTPKAVASKDASSTNQEAEKVRRALLDKFPNNPAPSHVAQSVIPGLYEVFAGGQVFYVDPSATYFVFGEMVDLKAQKNLSKSRADELNTIPSKELLHGESIQIKRGDGARVLHVFSDPHCPYCKKLEHELQKLDNVTIHIHLSPRPAAIDVAKQIACAKDPGNAWVAYMVHGESPAEEDAKNCTTKSFEYTDTLRQKYGITGTPTMFNADGKRLTGLAPAAELEKFLR